MSIRMHPASLLVLGAVLSAGLAMAQQPNRPPDSSDDAAAALGTGPAVKPGAPTAGRGRGGAGGGAEATRAFLGLGVAPDKAAAERGRPAYAENCSTCHGPDARGGIGPNLLYSSQVLDDDHGEKLVPFLRAGRPDKGMPPFASLGDRTLTDTAEFLHLQVENYANRGTYQNTNNILTGDVRKGEAFFRANCTACHSASGDLRGVAGRFRPLDLQRSMIFPARENHPERAIRATVTASGGTVEGRVTRIDDFEIVVTDNAGAVHAFRRGPAVRVALKDPLEWHKAFAYRLKDDEMTDLVTYLSTLK